MAMPLVLLLGATGQTGSSILDGLLEANCFKVEALVRTSSAGHEKFRTLSERGVALRAVDIEGSIEHIMDALSGVDILISAIDALSQLKQIKLAEAAKQAGVKRFVPCAFMTIAPPYGVMDLRDQEIVYNHIKRLFLPYTIIDTGVWYQTAFPRLPSGRVDYAMVFPKSEIHGDGRASNILTDLRDIGRFVARIISDHRTINKYVYTCGDVMSEEDIFALMEAASREEIKRDYVHKSGIEDRIARYRSILSEKPGDFNTQAQYFIEQYTYSRFIREDNREEYAKYLGYLNTRDLYPDFKPRRFSDFLQELLDGRAVRPYQRLRLGGR